jgi:hypothetical protein
VWIIGLVAGIALLAVLLLIVPVDVTFFVERKNALRLGGTASLLFGLIRRTWKTGRYRRQKADGPPAKRERPQKTGRFLPAAFGTPESAGKLLVCARDILRTLEVRELHARARIGLGDPGNTGMLFAALVPMSVFLRSLPVDVRVEPDFEKEAFEGCCRAGIRAVPIRLLRPLVSFLFSRAGWPLVRTVARPLLTMPRAASKMTSHS